MIISLQLADGGTVQVPPEALIAFQAGFRGAMLSPESTAFDDERRIWNGMIDRRPGLIVRCTGTADVVAAVRFARQQRCVVSVRGGGHNIAGLAVCEGGLMIDLSPMRGVWVDPKARLARAHAGCLLADVDREAQLHGLAAVLGFVSTTGIAGLTVGGGFGYLTRRHGWTCDTLRSVQVVAADGQVLRAALDDNADLFWALRGGGGNFGIVTSFEYELFPVGPEILGGVIAWRAEDAAEVLDFYRRFTATTPRETTCVAILRLAPPAPWLAKELHGQPIVALVVCHSGDVDDGEKLLAPLRALGRPVADTLSRRPYCQMQCLLDATQPKGRRYYWKSHYLAGIEAELIHVLIDRAKRLPSPHSAIFLFQIQGALNDRPADHSPAGNRDAAYVLNFAAAWDDAADDPGHLHWSREGFGATRSFATGGVYLNFLTEDEEGERIVAAYGKPNLERLAELKRKYDPDSVFRHTKSVVV